MACDGIYEADVFGRQDVITWIANKMETTQDLALICAALLDECLERGTPIKFSCHPSILQLTFKGVMTI